MRPRSTSPPPRQPGTASHHPLINHTDYADDVSRPTLKRLTGETERQVAESSQSASEAASSARSSMDLLRMTSVESTELEVMLHQVKQDESLAGIAVLYGINLSTLRKINKLWPSDPVHLRTHLYIPIEACRWNKASETFTRGPKPGQGTLGSQPIDIVRIPISQLDFFPRKKPPDTRRSLEQEMRRSIHHASGPSIQNDLRTLPPPLQPEPKPNVVRIRPTSGRLSTPLTDRLTSFFDIPEGTVDLEMKSRSKKLD